jgi:hypothetical protein
VDDISGLTLLQAADLVTLLKVGCVPAIFLRRDTHNITFWMQTRLNIQEIAMPTGPAIPVPAAVSTEDAAPAEVSCSSSFIQVHYVLN